MVVFYVVLLKKKDRNILIEYRVPSDANFLMPHDKIIIGIDWQYRVPVIETSFFWLLRNLDTSMA